MKRTTKQRLSRVMAAIMLISQFSPMGVYAASDDAEVEIVSEEVVEDTAEDAVEAGAEESEEAASDDAREEDTADAENDADSEDDAYTEEIADAESDDTDAADLEEDPAEEEIEDEEFEDVEFYEVEEVKDDEPERVGGVTLQRIGESYFQVHYNEPFTLEVEVTKDDDSEYTYEWYKGYGRYESNKLDSDTEKITIEEGISSQTEYYFYVIWEEDGEEKYTSTYFSVEPTNDFKAYVKGDENKWITARLSVPYGESTTLSVAVSAYDESNITYQWYSPEGEIDDATGEDYTINSITEKGTWYCIVNDGHTSQEVVFNLSIDNSFSAYAEGEEETSSSKTVTVLVGEDATLKVVATSADGELTYKWTDESTSSYKVLEETGSTLVVKKVVKDGWYRCTVSDQYGNTKDILFLVKIDNEFDLNIYVNGKEFGYWGDGYRPMIVSSEVGEEVELKVEATAHDKSKLEYQWYDSSEVAIENAKDEWSCVKI